MDVVDSNLCVASKGRPNVLLGWYFKLLTAIYTLIRNCYFHVSFTALLFKGSILVHVFLFIVIDCQVSDWTEWSKCDVSCGIGTSTRQRDVLRPESNGGRQCPLLEESRSCRATKCSKRHLDKVSALKGIWSFIVLVY